MFVDFQNPLTFTKYKGNDLPVVGKSVALFDYFNYKGEDDVYISNPLPGDDYFYNPILPVFECDMNLLQPQHRYSSLFPISDIKKRPFRRSERAVCTTLKEAGAYSYGIGQTE